MAETYLISEKELDLIKIETNKLSELLEEDVVFKEFKSHPILFLRANNFEKLIDILEENIEFIHSFVYNINFGFRNNRFFGRCEACKLAVLFILYKTLGIAGVGVYQFYRFITSILRNVKRFYGDDHEISKEIQASIDPYVETISPFQAARIICEELGYCPN